MKYNELECIIGYVQDIESMVLFPCNRSKKIKIFKEYLTNNTKILTMLRDNLTKEIKE